MERRDAKERFTVMSYRTNRRTHKRFKISRDAREYISEKIAILRDEGYPRSQAVAIAYDYARREGYRIPRKK
jgi:hypothetical protein